MKSPILPGSTPSESPASAYSTGLRPDLRRAVAGVATWRVQGVNRDCRTCLTKTVQGVGEVPEGVEEVA